MKRQHKKEKAVQLYAFFLKFYPQRYRHAFGSQMMQTFKDYYTDVIEVDEKPGACFWFDVVKDEVRGIMREQVTALKESNNIKDAWIQRGILFGVLLGVINSGYHLLNNLAPAHTTLINFLNTGMLVVVLIMTGIAGYATARKTGQMKTGLYAGLVTGILSIVIGMSALFVITFLFMDIIRHNAFMMYDFQQSGFQHTIERTTLTYE